MEEASGKDLHDFFQQWLYKPGTLKLKGTWQYNAKAKAVNITLDQVQSDGSMFKMPIEVQIYGASGKSQIATVQIDTKKNLFTLAVDEEPERLVLDPSAWVLMDAIFTKAK
jgi:aminopeptidase N